MPVACVWVCPDVEGAEGAEGVEDVVDVQLRPGLGMDLPNVYYHPLEGVGVGAGY